MLEPGARVPYTHSMAKRGHAKKVEGPPLFNAWRALLREIRAERGLSREAAAAKAGVSPSTLYRWETYPNGPAADWLATIAQGLGMDPDELAYRYAERLLEHYRGRCAAKVAAAGEPVDGPRPASPDGDGPRPLSLHGHSSRHGPVWVDLNELMDMIPRLRPGIARPRRIRATATAGVVRRPRKKRR